MKSSPVALASALLLTIACAPPPAEAPPEPKVDLPTPHGTIALTVPPGTSSGSKLRAKGQGVRPAQGEPGDLFAEVLIVLPEKLSDDDRQHMVKMAGAYNENPRGELSW